MPLHKICTQSAEYLERLLLCGGILSNKCQPVRKNLFTKVMVLLTHLVKLTESVLPCREGR